MRINYFRYAHLALGPLRAGIQALEDQNRYLGGPVISIKPRVTPVSQNFAGIAYVVVSPTGFEGICHNTLPLWGIPFQGMVAAA